MHKLDVITGLAGGEVRWTRSGGGQGQDWEGRDLPAANRGSIRVACSRDYPDESRIQVYRFDHPEVLEWGMEFDPSVPPAVIVAALRATPGFPR